MNEDIRDLIAIEQGVEECDNHCAKCGEPIEDEINLCDDCTEEERQEWWNRLSSKEKDELIRHAGR